MSSNSKYSDKLFKINHKNGTLEINKIEVRETKAYRDILERDKGGKVKGDFDGRKKLFARMELLYVYVMADPFSMYAVLNQDRKHRQALETSGLRGIEGWKPDIVIERAISQYERDVELSPIGYAFVNARKALYNIGQDIDLFNTMNEEIRARISEEQSVLNSHPDEEEKQKSEEALKSLVKELGRNNKDIFELTSTLPDRLDSLEKLKLRLSEEDNELQTVIGGGTTFNREDPNL